MPPGLSKRVGIATDHGGFALKRRGRVSRPPRFTIRNYFREPL